MNPDTVTYQIGDEVYHRTDSDMGIVTSICYRENGITYGVMWSPHGSESYHYSCELVLDKPVIGTNKKDE